MGNLIVRLHLRLRCIVVAFFMVSIALLWFVRMQSCRSYLETWTGMLPVQARTHATLAHVLQSAWCPYGVYLHTLREHQDPPVSVSVEMHRTAQECWRESISWAAAVPCVSRRLRARPSCHEPVHGPGLT